MLTTGSHDYLSVSSWLLMLKVAVSRDFLTIFGGIEPPWAPDKKGSNGFAHILEKFYILFQDKKRPTKIKLMPAKLHAVLACGESDSANTAQS